VRPGLNGTIRIKGDHEHKLEPVSPGIYEIALKPGEEVLLHVESNPSPQSAGEALRERQFCPVLP